MIATLLAVVLATPALAAEEKPQEAAAEAPAKTQAAAPAEADGPPTREEVNALAAELRRLKLEMGLGETEYRSYQGMGPAASKVYFAPKGLAIGGYGEAFYRNYRGDDLRDDSDIYRVVLYTGYRFTPKIVFNSEVEFEHQNEVHVEFAYLDFLLSDAVRVRVGNMLVPMGFVNEMHEPAFFNGVFRPDLETNLIPSTWNENGVGLHGELGGLRYKAFALVGLNATNGKLGARSWLRGARTAGGRSPADDFAGVLNLSYDLGPASLGGAVYGGRAGQGVELDGREIDATVFLAEAHAQLVWRGLSARAIYAMGSLGDSDLISRLQELAPENVIGSEARGGYVEVAYDVMPLVAPDTTHALSPFLRLETIDLHADVAGDGVRNDAFQTDIVTAGLTYKPIPQVVLKGDWQRRIPGAGEAVSQVNVGAGFVF